MLLCKIRRGGGGGGKRGQGKWLCLAKLYNLEWNPAIRTFIGYYQSILYSGLLNMTEIEPTIEEWKRLYDAAIQFKQHECWNHMWDGDIIGVRNPETGEIGYCSIMGRNGEHFALGVYKGSDGLSGLVSIYNGEINATGIDALHIQNCLMASFEDRKLIDKKDHELMKKLGLRFRGRNAWPLFRDYTPGFHPWYLNSKDVRFLTIALQQSIEIAMRMQHDPDTLLQEDESLYLVRVPHFVKNVVIWKDEWLEPLPITTEIAQVDFSKDSDNRNPFKSLMQKDHKGDWEIGTFYSPKGVREGSNRPYYPKIIMYANQDSGMILSLFIATKFDYQEDFLQHFLSCLEDAEYLPESIVASNDEILALLYPITEKLNIELYETDRLDIIRDAQSEMFNFVHQG